MWCLRGGFRGGRSFASMVTFLFGEFLTSHNVETECCFLMIAVLKQDGGSGLLEPLVLQKGKCFCTAR